MNYPQLPPDKLGITLPSGRTVPSHWTGMNNKLTWVGAGNVSAAYDGTDGRFAVWQSPVFDLRAHLEDAQQSADTDKLGTVPIYSAACSLYVMATITTPNGATFFDTLNITSVERAHPWNPFSLKPITSEVNVTTVYTSGARPYGPLTVPDSGVSGMGIYSPPMGANGPVRFWQLQLIWRRYDQAPDPVIVVGSALY
jgi:hypothetical protein